MEEALEEIAANYSSHSEAARACGINKAYWFRLKSGELFNPSEETLNALGLRKVVTYEWLPDDDAT